MLSLCPCLLSLQQKIKTVWSPVTQELPEALPKTHLLWLPPPDFAPNRFLPADFNVLHSLYGSPNRPSLFGGSFSALNSTFLPCMLRAPSLSTTVRPMLQTSILHCIIYFSHYCNQMTGRKQLMKMCQLLLCCCDKRPCPVIVNYRRKSLLRLMVPEEAFKWWKGTEAGDRTESWEMTSTIAITKQKEWTGSYKLPTSTPVMDFLQQGHTFITSPKHHQQRPNVQIRESMRVISHLSHYKEMGLALAHSSKEHSPCGGKGMGAGVGNVWSLCSYSQEAEKRECWCSLPFSFFIQSSLCDGATHSRVSFPI